jgi:hypothetical protein
MQPLKIGRAGKSAVVSSSYVIITNGE